MVSGESVSLPLRLPMSSNTVCYSSTTSSYEDSPNLIYFIFSLVLQAQCRFPAKPCDTIHASAMGSSPHCSGAAQMPTIFSTFLALYRTTRPRLLCLCFLGGKPQLFSRLTRGASRVIRVAVCTQRKYTSHILNLKHQKTENTGTGGRGRGCTRSSTSCITCNSAKHK